MSTIYRVTIVAETDGEYETLGEVAVPGTSIVRTAGAVLIEVVNEHRERGQAVPAQMAGRELRPFTVNVTGPQGGDPEQDESDENEPAPVAGEEPKPRRPRRTKAQMAADKEAAERLAASNEARNAAGEQSSVTADPVEPEQLGTPGVVDAAVIAQYEVPPADEPQQVAASGPTFNPFA